MKQWIYDHHRWIQKMAEKFAIILSTSTSVYFYNETMYIKWNNYKSIAW